MEPEIPERFTPGDIFSGGFGGLYMLVTLAPGSQTMVSLSKGLSYDGSFDALDDREWPTTCEKHHTWTYVGRLVPSNSK